MLLGSFLQQKTTQTLSTQLKESLDILNMSMTELQDFLQKEELENPLIDESLGQPIVFYEHDTYFSNNGDSDYDPFVGIPKENDSVYDLVHDQILKCGLDYVETQVAEWCLSNLDNNGFLSIDNSEISEILNIPIDSVNSTLSKIKQFEPLGIFSNNLVECLCTQAEYHEKKDLLIPIIQNHLQDIAEGRISNISRALSMSTVDVRLLIHEIRKLNPRPLNGIGGAQPQYIVPDLILSFEDGTWHIGLNYRGGEAIRTNDFYCQMMKTISDKELKQYFSQKMRRVKFLINALEQRQNTLKSIGAYFIRTQSDYLLGKGPLYTMTMQELSDSIGVNISTVSRAVHDKYLTCPRGCICMRDMFSSGVGGNQNLSRNAVKDRLKELVSGEDSAHPYSDEVLSKLLKKEGIDISRRTVAKYRDELGIAGTSVRRQKL